MRSGKRVTTRDIAEQLNLSVSTVGRALAQDSRISVETRHRVEQKAAELGYVGNQAARMMRGASSKVIGLMVPDVGNVFYSTAAHALAQCMSKQGYQVMLCETSDDRDNELAQVKGMIAGQVAGVIVVPTPNPRSESIRLLRQVPHVQFLRTHPELAKQSFGIDDRGVLSEATRHLRDLGHTRIAYLGGLPGLSTGHQRFAGYLDVVGDDHDPDLVAHIPPGASDSARDALARLLDSPNPPSAVVTASVRVTEGVLEELDARRVAVPRELSVVGFGDQPGFGWWGPGLTTMALPVHEVATACSMWLLQRLGDSGRSAPFSSNTGGYLRTRGSTAVPAQRR
ncbi:LacI family DNA-binding transcriptional regulator [Streptomyces canus]|uniref:LacI family DNA-binding transcriptional regulator n=1 Tax=Streptomyces TaxID=1883 RepID=UPI000851EDB3|nr:LacI family DNA-binding transcriptional regulator [Streptomyces sp. LUP47B]